MPTGDGSQSLLQLLESSSDPPLPEISASLLGRLGDKQTIDPLFVRLGAKRWKRE
jgi:hypothetical protein